jgi:hypothetical protein
MSGRIRSHLRSNVIAYLALFAALSGTAIAAAPRNSVNSKSIKNGAVHKEDIGANAVDGSKVQDESLTGADVANNSLNGVDINGPTLTGVDADTVGGVPASQLQFGNGVDVGGGTTTFSGTDTALTTPDGTLDVGCDATPVVSFGDGGTDGSNTFVWTFGASAGAVPTTTSSTDFHDVADGNTSGDIAIAPDSETTVVLFAPGPGWVISAHLGVHFVSGTTCVVALTAQLNG